MLPQGRFQQFLEADSGQREQILRALFETGRYGATSNWRCTDEALDAQRSAEQITTQRDEVAAPGGDQRRRGARRAAAPASPSTRRAPADARRDRRRATTRSSAAGAAARRGRLDEAQERDEAAAEATPAAASARRRGAGAARRTGGPVARPSRSPTWRGRQPSGRRRGGLRATSGWRRSEAAKAGGRRARRPPRRRSRRRRREAASASTPTAEVARLSSSEHDLAARATRRRRAPKRPWPPCAATRQRSRPTLDWRPRGTGRATRAALGRGAGGAPGAGALADRQPCPVCGSTDHPSPARLPDEAPSRRTRSRRRGRPRRPRSNGATQRERPCRTAEASPPPPTLAQSSARKSIPAELADPGGAHRGACRRAGAGKAATEADVAAVRRGARGGESPPRAAARARRGGRGPAAGRPERAAAADELFAQRLESCGFSTRTRPRRAARLDRRPPTSSPLSSRHDEDATLRPRSGTGSRTRPPPASRASRTSTLLEQAATKTADGGGAALAEACRHRRTLGRTPHAAETQLARLQRSTPRREA